MLGGSPNDGEQRLMSRSRPGRQIASHWTIEEWLRINQARGNISFFGICLPPEQTFSSDLHGGRGVPGQETLLSPLRWRRRSCAHLTNSFPLLAFDIQCKTRLINQRHKRNKPDPDESDDRRDVTWLVIKLMIFDKCVCVIAGASSAAGINSRRSFGWTPVLLINHEAFALGYYDVWWIGDYWPPDFLKGPADLGSYLFLILNDNESLMRISRFYQEVI